MTSTSQTSKPAINIDGADVVIKSNDNAEFCVQRTALALFSPVFADILSLPQPEGSPYSLPVVPVSEDGVLFLFFVSLCYRFPLPTLSLARLENVLQTLDKYGVVRVPVEITHQLTKHINEDPVRTCAVACRYSLYDIANQAAKATRRDLASKISSLPSDYLNLMGLEHYQKLIHYRLQASEVAALVIQQFPTNNDVDFINNSDFEVYVPGTRNNDDSCTCPLIRFGFGNDRSLDVPLYITPWLEALKAACLAAVQERPDWETVSANSALAMEAVKPVMRSSCSICAREVLECHKTLAYMGTRVKQSLEEIPLPFQAGSEK